jgi:hypothetical protein
MIRSHEQAVKVIFHRIAGGAVVSPGKEPWAHFFIFYFPCLPVAQSAGAGRCHSTTGAWSGTHIARCNSTAQHSTWAGVRTQ